jgi:hypothetical protein
MKKKGLSTVIITLILIVISLVAIGAVWLVVSNLLKGQSENVGTDKLTFSANIERVTLQDSVNNASITVERKVGAGDMKGMKFYFYNSTSVEVRTEYVAINELVSRKFSFNLNMNISSLEKISIVPIFNSKDGKDNLGNVADTYDVKNSVHINTETNEPCNPATCASLGYSCESWPDGCGAVINCGTCNGNCLNGQCQACTPATCLSLGKNCNTWANGTCSGTLNCGTCTSPQTCNSTGQCVSSTCVPTTCAASGYVCGPLANGTCSGTLNCGTCSSGTCVSGQCITSLSTDRNLGINLFVSQEYYAEDRLFADAMKTALPWEASSLDSNGWPNSGTSASIILWDGINNMNGVYHIEGYSNSQPTISGVSNLVYSSSTKKFSGDLTYSDSGSGGFGLQFNNIGGWLRNVSLMKPLYAGATSSYPIGTNFTNQIKAAVNNFSVIRFMWNVDGWNGPWQVAWSDRVNPNLATFYGEGGQTYSRYGQSYQINWAGKGMAWEYAIQFANELGKDMWINIPLGANDDYVRQLATLFKNNYKVTNGKIYWEYSNEATWDFAGMTSRYLVERGTTLRSSTPIGYDGTTDSAVLAARYYGERALQISNLWREVWGDSNMITRIRPVLSGQLGYDAELTYSLDFLNSYYNNGDGTRVSTPHPVSYYFYGSGGSHYTGNNPSGSPPSEYDEPTNANEIQSFERYEEEEACIAKMYGLKRVAYEGGVEASSSTYQLSRITDAMVSYHALWDKYGGDLLVYYVTTGGEDSGTAFGFTQNMFNLNTRKYSGLNTIISTAKPAVTGGKLMPGTLQGADFSFNGAIWQHPAAGGAETSGSQEFNQWLPFMGYLFRVNTDKTYKIKLNYQSGQSNKIEIMVDGIIIGSETLSAAGSATNSREYSVTLTSGMHGIRVRNYDDESFFLNSIIIS